MDSGDHGLEHQAHVCAAGGVKGGKVRICVAKTDHTKPTSFIAEAFTTERPRSQFRSTENLAESALPRTFDSNPTGS